MKTLIYIILVSFWIPSGLFSQTFNLEAGKTQSIQFQGRVGSHEELYEFSLLRGVGDTFSGVGYNRRFKIETHFNLLIPNFRQKAITFGAYEEYLVDKGNKLVFKTSLDDDHYFNLKDTTVFGTWCFGGSFDGPTYRYNIDRCDTCLHSFSIYNHGNLEYTCRFDSVGDTLQMLNNKYPSRLKKEYYIKNRLRSYESRDTGKAQIIKKWWPNGNLKYELTTGRSIWYEAKYNQQGEVYYERDMDQQKIWEIDTGFTNEIDIDLKTPGVVSFFDARGKIKKRIIISKVSGRPKWRRLSKKWKRYAWIKKKEQYFNKWGMVKRSKSSFADFQGNHTIEQSHCGNVPRQVSISPINFEPQVTDYESRLKNSFDQLEKFSISSKNHGKYIFEVFVRDGFIVDSVKLLSSPEKSNTQFSEKLRTIMNQGLIFGSKYNRDAFPIFSMIYTLEIKL